VIASLRGTVASKTQHQVVLDVNGVGYLVYVTPNTSASLQTASSAFLHIAMIVREDALNLFGFATALEQELFDLLRSVTGVGPKSALAILGNLSTGQIASAVALDDDAAFRSVSGIGPKTAKLITVTLAGKLSHLVGVNEPALASAPEDYTSVIEALISLGWPEKSATDAVKSAAGNSKMGAGRDVILRASLALLGSTKSQLSGDK
jgi:Holliday junction DNA helicase RuvA